MDVYAAVAQGPHSTCAGVFAFHTLLNGTQPRSLQSS